MTPQQARDRVAKEEYGCSWLYMLTFVKSEETLNKLIDRAILLYHNEQTKT